MWFVSRQGDDSPTKDSAVTQQNTSTPFVQLNIPENSLLLSQEKKFIQISIKTDDYDNITSVDYLVDDEIVSRATVSPFTVDIDISNLEPGDHTLQAFAYNKAGNVGKSEVFTFTIVENKPVKPADTASQAIVRQSTSLGSLGNTSGGTGSSGSHHSGGDGQPGGEEDDDDDDGEEDVTPWPDAPVAQICGNTTLLSGPSSAPAGAVVVPAGDNSEPDFFEIADTTYWFAPGTHTLGTDEFSQIVPGNNSTFIGAPGAVIDGQGLNRYAFTQHATNVRIKYLTIKNFVTPLDEGTINHNSGVDWTMEYITAQNNGGGAVFLGSNNTLRHSCLKDNGQYGFQVYSDEEGGPTNVLLDHNEVVGNNQDDWESQVAGCGCTGGGKFWDAHAVTITNNYIHNNLSVGLWADTNDTDFLIENNYISENDGQGIFYEISYNMIVRNNNFVRNALVDGPGNPGFPTGAIYLSESGGDSRVAGRTANIEIYDNSFTDNWSGVILWENADRFCASPANTSSGTCTLVNPDATLASCTDPANGGSVDEEPYLSDCRWKTQNVKVHDNTFGMDRANIPDCSVDTACGFQGMFSNEGSFPSWSPYMGTGIQKDIALHQNNLFSSNTYTGDWKFMAQEQNTVYNFALWQAAPFNQDIGSTFNGEDYLVVPNSIDDATATLEESIGKWDSWFSTTVARTTTEAHSGTHSLQVTIDAPFGWGVQLNSTGYPILVNQKRLSFWAKLGSGTNLSTRMEVQWRDEDGDVLREDTLLSPLLTSEWQESSVIVTPPNGAISVSVAFAHSSGTTGNVVYLDDIYIADTE